MDNLEEARNILEHSRKIRVDACQHAIEEALKEHRCRIDVAMILSPSAGIVPQISLVSVD